MRHPRSRWRRSLLGRYQDLVSLSTSAPRTPPAKAKPNVTFIHVAKSVVWLKQPIPAGSVQRGHFRTAVVSEGPQGQGFGLAQPLQFLGSVDESRLTAGDYEPSGVPRCCSAEIGSHLLFSPHTAGPLELPCELVDL
jgi:hypothetical protein